MNQAESTNTPEKHTTRADWTPPPVNKKKIADLAAKELNITDQRLCFFFFRTEPYDGIWCRSIYELKITSEKTVDANREIMVSLDSKERG